MTFSAQYFQNSTDWAQSENISNILFCQKLVMEQIQLKPCKPIQILVQLSLVHAFSCEAQLSTQQPIRDGSSSSQEHLCKAVEHWVSDTLHP